MAKSYSSVGEDGSDRIPVAVGVSRSCGNCCFTCTQRSGECTAAIAKKMSPKTIKGAKQCTACSILMLIIAVGLIVQSFFVPPLLHKDLVDGLQDAVLLNDSTTSQFAKWTDNSANPLMLTAYVYNIENPEGILEGEKPRLTEMGPYVYRQYTINYNYSFGSNESYFGPDSSRRTLIFRTYEWYEFAPELSVGPEDINVTTINMPFVSLRGIYEKSGQLAALHSIFSAYSIYKDAPDSVRLFTTKTVHEVLFGWTDPVMTLLGKPYRGYITNYPSLAASMEADFASNQYSIIYTGGDDTFPVIRNYLTWHNKSFIANCPNPYPTDQCDLSVVIPAWNNNTDGPPTVASNGQPANVAQLRGNDGSVFPTPLNEQSILTTYFSPLIRSVDIEYKGATHYKGVPLLQYGFPDTFFSNSESYPPNGAYLQDGPDGLINMTLQQANIPIFVSQPRFQKCDPQLADAIEPTYADSNQISETLYEVEPESGVTFHVLTASQVNLYISPLSFPSTVPPGNLTWFAGLRQPLYFPVMWAQEEGGIDNSDAEVITTVLGIIAVSEIGGLVVGVFLAVLAVIYLFLSWRIYDLETNKHLSAVRSLLAHDSTPNTMMIDGGSILDASVLVMQEDRDRPNTTRHDEQEDIDITYRHAPKLKQEEYQQEG